MTKLRALFATLQNRAERYAGTDLTYLAQSGFWMNVSSVAVSLFSLGLYIIFANFLPRETYGTYQYFLSIAVIIGTLTLTGMNSAVTRAVARGYDGTLVRAVRYQLLAGVLPFVAALIGAGYYFVNGNVVLASGFLLIGILMPLANAFNTYGAYLVGKESFSRLTFYSFAQYIPYYGLLALTAIFIPNALALLAVNLVVNAVALFFIYRHLLKQDKPSGKSDPEATRYGTELSVIGAFPAIAGQLDAVMAFHFLGAGGLAIYAFATALPDRLGSLFKFFPVAALPKFSQMEDADIRRTIGPKLFKLGLLAIAAAGVYALIVPVFFHVLFPTYLDAIPYSQAYSFALVLMVSHVASAALTAKARTRDLYAANIVTSILGLLIQLVGIVNFGLWGLVCGKVASGLLSSLIFSILLIRAPQARAR